MKLPQVISAVIDRYRRSIWFAMSWRLEVASALGEADLVEAAEEEEEEVHQEV